MLSLNEKFLLGKYKRIFYVKSTFGNPIQILFNSMFKKGLIDGLLTCGDIKGKPQPKLFLEAYHVKPLTLNRCFGINALLKKAIQKYRLNKLAVLAPSCMFDGLNKTQYFGIGCNWTKTAVALKVGTICFGALTEVAQKVEVLHITGKEEEVERLFFEEGKLYYRLKTGRDVEVPFEVHHTYSLSACRYCLNLSSKGTDITFVPKREANEGLFIVRSERGWYTIAQVQKAYPETLNFKLATKEEIESLVNGLREKVLLNIYDILERIELGLPIPKWSDNKLRKFYRAWNSVEDTNLEEEVF